MFPVMRVAPVALLLLGCASGAVRSESDGGVVPPGEAGIAETCGNGLDDDRDGVADDGCSCLPGSTQSCFTGDPALPGRGVCKTGTQTCTGVGEHGQWAGCDGEVGPGPEACNQLDDDCNGTVDDLAGGIPCVIVDVNVDIDGDCVTASCPAQAPYPIGCTIQMDGSDSRGCVASSPQASAVFFKEGDKCGVGHVSGTLRCASVAGAPLDGASCPINKQNPIYPASPNGCP